MDKTFLGLLQTQVDTLVNNDSEDANKIILETVKLLLDNVDLSAEKLSAYDKIGIRRIFSAYNYIGTSICGFYDTSKSQLDPAAQNGAIGKAIAEVSEQITAMTASFDELTEKEATMLNKEEELRVIDTRYRELAQKIDELRKIQETVSDEIIEKLKKDSKELEASIKINKDKKEDVEAKIRKLRRLLSDAEAAYVEVDSEQKQIKTNIIDIIDRHYDEIVAFYNGRSAGIGTLKAEIAEYIRMFEQLDSAVIDSADTKNFYESWLSENSTIISSMRKYGVESVSDITEAINNAKANAEYELKAYDAIVRKVVINEEAARDAIAKKQNKNV